jgi:two-component system chemotaxis response regulator CheY
VIQALDENRPYDLICMDLLMPDVSGLEAIQLIRLQEERHECTRRSGIIVITSSEDTGSINAAFRQLADAYIVKPVDTHAFLNVVGCLCPMEVRPA